MQFVCFILQQQEATVHEILQSDSNCQGYDLSLRCSYYVRRIMMQTALSP